VSSLPACHYVCVYRRLRVCVTMLYLYRSAWRPRRLPNVIWRLCSRHSVLVCLSMLLLVRCVCYWSFRVYLTRRAVYSQQSSLLISYCELAVACVCVCVCVIVRMCNCRVVTFQVIESKDEKTNKQKTTSEPEAQVRPVRRLVPPPPRRPARKTLSV